MKRLDFKTAPQLFEQERDGIKPFTIRKRDWKDKRFQSLSHWDKDLIWKIRIYNSKTYEYFDRIITNVSYLWYYDNRLRHLNANENWIIIHFRPE